jgi:hypothetical protein
MNVSQHPAGRTHHTPLHAAPVIPAQAGIYNAKLASASGQRWITACAGMASVADYSFQSGNRI